MANSSTKDALHSITKHNNIVISGVGANEVLKFDGSNWINQTLAEAGIAPAAAAGAVTRVGGNTSEITTNSTTAADIAGVSSISIAKNDPYQLVFNARKTSGGSGKAAVGLKINDTIINEASLSGTICWVSSATDRAEDGLAWQEIGARDTLYLNSYNQYHTAQVSSTGAFGVANFGGITATAPYPNAIVTSINFRAISPSGVTLGIKHVQIYSRSSS